MPRSIHIISRYNTYRESKKKEALEYDLETFNRHFRKKGYSIKPTDILERMKGHSIKPNI